MKPNKHLGIYLLMASVIGVAGFAKVGDEIENRLCNAHVLPCVVLAEVR